MAKLASAVWKDATTVLLLGLHGEQAPSDEEWDHYCSFIRDCLPHPNGGSIVLTDGGAPSSAQRERLRKHLGTASRWTAVITDKAVVRGVVTAVRWFNPKVCAFAPWELRDGFKFVGVREDQIRGVCDALVELDQQLKPRSRVLADALTYFDHDGSGKKA